MVASERADDGGRSTKAAQAAQAAGERRRASEISTVLAGRTIATIIIRCGPSPARITTWRRSATLRPLSGCHNGGLKNSSDAVNYDETEEAHLASLTVLRAPTGEATVAHGTHEQLEERRRSNRRRYVQNEGRRHLPATYIPGRCGDPSAAMPYNRARIAAVSWYICHRQMASFSIWEISSPVGSASFLASFVCAMGDGRFASGGAQHRKRRQVGFLGFVVVDGVR